MNPSRIIRRRTSPQAILLCAPVLLAASMTVAQVTAPQYDQMPPVVKIGQAATIAAWPPPHEIAADKRILETLTREIFLQEGDEFGVVDSKNNPLRPVPTSDWWTDVVMNGDGGTLWQYPIVPKVANNFVEIRAIGGTRPNSNGTGRETVAPVRVGAWSGQDTAAKPKEAPYIPLEKARASRWSDWMFSFRKTDAADKANFVDVTLARSNPYAWFEFSKSDALLSFDEKSTVAFMDASGKELATADLGTRDTLVLKVDGKLFGVYLPEGSSLRALPGPGGVVVKFAGEQKYVVVSALPGLDLVPVFAKYAYAKPVKTNIDYKYDPKNPSNAVRTKWTYEVKALRPGADTVLQGWLAPHYRGTVNNFAFVPGADFDTPRGKLRCAVASASEGFTIDYPFAGLPSHLAPPKKLGLPNDYDAEYERALLLKYDAENDGVAGDTYFGAKRLVLHARAMQMAKDLGMTETYENLKSEIEASLADWFTYKDGEENHYFARNDRWGSMVGFNFIHDFNLGRFTDIHFHYGYYTLAFAYVAMEDPEFRDKYKDLVIELAQAYAEWDKKSKRYPWMRTFEPMVGHSYAAGASSPGGNNQESSSESIQAWAGLFLLGEALRGNDPRADDILAAGAFGYAIETRAVLEYYQDYHGAPWAGNPLDFDNKPAEGDKRYGIWPDEFRNSRTVRNYPEKTAIVASNGIMGDGGNTFATYFGAQPEYIYGIQWLPNAPHMMFLARDPKFTLGQFTALMGYRHLHFASGWIGALDNAPRQLRTEWYKKATDRNPDPRLFSIDNPWSGQDMKGIVQNLYRLNPAYVKDISHEGDPVRDNPLYDEKAGKWLVQFPADRPKDVVFPKEIWNPEALISTYPQFVPPETEAGLASYPLAIWATKGFLPPVGPGVDWNELAKQMAWNPKDYPDTPEGRVQSISQLTTALESVGGSWPLIALTFEGFADPEIGVDVMAESRKRNNAFANHTETGMFANYYFYSLRGLGTPVEDQHVSIPSSIVLRDAKTGVTSYVVHNKSDTFEMADVYDGTKKIGQVLAAPKTVTTQKGLFAAADGLAAVGTIPMAGEPSVSLTEDKVVVVFSQPVDPASIDDEVTIAGPGGVKLQFVPGGNAQVATYQVVGDWTPGAQYQVTVPAGIRAASGGLTTDKPASFGFTISKGDGCKLVSSTPGAGATGVSPSIPTIELSFNSKINLATVQGVTLAGPGDPAVTLDSAASAGGRVVLKLSKGLKPGDTYTLTLPASLADVYGQTLGSATTVAFVTTTPDSVLADYDTVIDAPKLRQTGTSGKRAEPFEQGTRWNFTTVGDYVELALKVDKAGRYKIGATGKAYGSRGVISAAVDGQKVGQPWEQFKGNGLITFDYGTVDLKEGVNTLRFEVVGVNPAEKEKPWFVLRQLNVSPVK